MILNHNDLHRKNLIIEKTNSKIFVLDHEYAALNLIGIDIANYLNESIFDYCPKYKCEMDKVDIDALIYFTKRNIFQLLYIGIYNPDENIKTVYGGESGLLSLIKGYYGLLEDLQDFKEREERYYANKE